MYFTVSFTYEGGQNIDVVMSNSELKRFLQSISKSEVYWDDKGGFWLAFNKLLYFKAIPVKEELPNTKNNELVE